MTTIALGPEEELDVYQLWIRTKRQHVGGTVRREGGARWDRTGQGLDVDGRGWHSQVPRVTRRS